jgi:hypothetical protein
MCGISDNAILPVDPSTVYKVSINSIILSKTASVVTNTCDNILLNTLILITLSLCSFLSPRDLVMYPYKVSFAVLMLRCKRGKGKTIFCELNGSKRST